MAQTLEQRLASAGKSTRLTEITQLIADATTERDAQAALHVAQSADAVNFRLAEADRDEAAKAAEKAARNAAMLDAAIADLEDKLQARRETDKRASAEAERKAALAERDELAKRIQAEWPVLSESMVDLFEAIQANEARMKYLGLYDLSAEAIARGCDGMFRFGASQGRRLTAMRVPEFNGARDAWPRPQTVGMVDMRALKAETLRQMAEAEASGPKFIWHRAKVTNGHGNPFRGKFRDGTMGVGQISNGDNDIQITEQEAARLNSVPGVTVTKLDKAPPAPATYFVHPAAA